MTDNDPRDADDLAEPGDGGAGNSISPRHERPEDVARMQAARMREALSAMDGFRKALERTAAEQLAAANALAGLLVLLATANRKEGETDA